MSVTDLSRRSSWLKTMTYFRAPDGASYLAMEAKNGMLTLYRGVSSRIPGLIAAGVWKTSYDGKAGYFSVGSAYHRYLRSGLIPSIVPRETIKPEKVGEIKQLIANALSEGRRHRNGRKATARSHSQVIGRL